MLISNCKFAFHGDQLCDEIHHFRTKLILNDDNNYVHPPGGWIYYFCFFRRPMSGVRCPASHMVSAHLKEKY